MNQLSGARSLGGTWLLILLTTGAALAQDEQADPVSRLDELGAIVNTDAQGNVVAVDLSGVEPIEVRSGAWAGFVGTFGLRTQCLCYEVAPEAQVVGPLEFKRGRICR